MELWATLSATSIWIKVLSAKDNALATQLSIIDLELELTKLQTITNLYQALGGGWK